MLWSECYERIQRMSPKAAKLASRMLSKDPKVPSHWAFALEVALTGRGQGAGSFSAADLEAIVASRQGRRPDAAAHLDREQQEAWALTSSIRQSAVADRAKLASAPNASPGDVLWDPRMPTPEEAWLLAFSHEFRRIADGRFELDDIARQALRRFQTDGHRNPLVVAREQFVVGRAFP